jgi:hypothetical protein
MIAREILKRLYDDIVSWGKVGKLVSLARDPFDVLEILAQGPQGFRVILHWAGEQEVGGQPQLPIVQHRIEAILSYNLGLTATPDLALLSKGPANDRPALLDLVEELRRRIASYNFPDGETDVFMAYVGCDPFVTPDGVPLAAYKLTFTLTAGLPQPSYRNP